MSLANTTLVSACAVDARQIVVASASGIAIGYKLRIDDETFQVTKGYVSGSAIVPVLRGQEGTIAQAHASGAQVTSGAAADYTMNTPPQTTAPFNIAGRARVITSYSADGAIAHPPAGADALAVISGTAHTGLTLAAPAKELNGSVLTILDLTAAAHVVTIAGGLGGGALNTATFDSGGRCAMSLLAYNEIWYPFPAPFSGTLTSIDVALTTV